MIEIGATPALEPHAIVDRVKSLTGDAYLSGRVDRGDPIVEVANHAAASLGPRLREDPSLLFEQLVDITCVHWPLDTGREFELVYQYRSVRRNLFLRVKARVSESESIASLANDFQSARWLEREVYDLFGVTFDGHPDLRRILLPEGYEGHPLRKDYPVEGPTFPDDAHRADLLGTMDPDDFWTDVDG